MVCVPPLWVKIVFEFEVLNNHEKKSGYSTKSYETIVAADFMIDGEMLHICLTFNIIKWI